MDLPRIFGLFLILALHAFVPTDGQKWSPSSGGKSYSKSGDGYDRCKAEGEPITIPFCKNLPYTQTIFPNLMGNQNQDEAGLEVHQYYPLVKIKCSPDIQFFLCAMYAPVCTILEKPLPPCKELCQSAKEGCEDLMVQFGFTWPDKLDCDKFPSSGPHALCVGDNNGGDISEEDLRSHATSKPFITERPNRYEDMQDFVCPAPLRVPPDHEYKLSIGHSPRIVNVTDCGAPCYRLFFSESDIGKMQLWVGICAIVCLLSTLFTTITFCIDTSRFLYPEKPIVYLSMCYLIVAVVYIIGWISQDSISCNDPFESSTPNLEMERVLKQGVLHDWRCSVVGMVLYFFIMAGAGWWLALTIAWFLSAGLKWSMEAIDAYATYFHGTVWALASLQTIVVLIVKKIEGDILSGVCFVGILQTDSLLYLVILPLAIYLILGFMFLVAGFICLIQVCHIMKKDGNKTNQLESYILRIALFSTLYLISASVVLACHIYEYINLPEWMQNWQETICRDSELKSEWQTPCRYPDHHYDKNFGPAFHVFMLKYGMINGIGIFSGVWVWKGKTISTWRNCGSHTYRQATV